MNLFRSISHLKQSISQKNPRFEDHYDLKQKLGAGSFATVYACEAKTDRGGLQVAVKVFDRTAKRGLRREYRGECQLLRMITPNEQCVQMIDAFESRKFCHIVMEKCGVSVQDAFVKGCVHEVNELDLAHLCKCMLKGLQHLHECSVVHRDVKPANLLLANGSSELLSSRPLVKICDLGLAAQLPPRGLNEICGTAPYMAPEMLLKKTMYREGVDIWSAGVTAYLMLFGSYPYKDRCFDPSLVKEAIRDGKTVPKFQVRKGFAQPSDNAVKFVRLLLQRKPQLRPDATRALSSRYITQLSEPSPTEEAMPSFGPTLSLVSEITRDEPAAEMPVVRDLHDDSNDDGSSSDSTHCGQSSDKGLSRTSTCETMPKVVTNL